jgi:type I restriction enzyme R subunit
MPMNESETKTRLINPIIHQRGWTEDLIRREEITGSIEINDSGPYRRQKTGETHLQHFIWPMKLGLPIAIGERRFSLSSKRPCSFDALVSLWINCGVITPLCLNNINAAILEVI